MKNHVVALVVAVVVAAAAAVVVVVVILYLGAIVRKGRKGAESQTHVLPGSARLF